MSKATERRTETDRFATNFETRELIEGDRIDPILVARDEVQLGSPIRRTQPDEEDNPDTQLVTVTEMDSLDDVHRAILFDPDAGVWVRASCHSSQSAWSQRERDWKVRDVGDSLTVSNGRLAESNEEYDDEESHVNGWAEIVLSDPFGLHDGRRIDSGNTIRLRDPYESEVGYADVDFEWSGEE